VHPAQVLGHAPASVAAGAARLPRLAQLDEEVALVLAELHRAHHDDAVLPAGGAMQQVVRGYTLCVLLGRGKGGRQACSQPARQALSTAQSIQRQAPLTC
jgi:hypothetical protein